MVSTIRVRLYVPCCLVPYLVVFMEWRSLCFSVLFAQQWMDGGCRFVGGGSVEFTISWPCAWEKEIEEEDKALQKPKCTTRYWLNHISRLLEGGPSQRPAPDEGRYYFNSSLLLATCCFCCCCCCCFLWFRVSQFP